MFTTAATTNLSRADRFLLRTVQIGAWVGVALAVYAGLIVKIVNVANGHVWTPLRIWIDAPQTNGVVLPAPNQLVETMLLVHRQPPLLTGVMLGADLVRGAGIMLVLVGIAVLARRALRGRAFSESTTPLGLVLIGVAGCPILADALAGVVSLGTFEAMGSPVNIAPAMTFSPVPILLGLVVLAMMIIFRVAARAQRDTEGLV